MKLTPINSQMLTTKKPTRFNTVKVTGYGAVAAGLLCAATAKKQKQHRLWAAMALLLSAGHILIIESYKFRKNG